jgi:membrane protease YdiL (CAAX protease family)
MYIGVAVCASLLVNLASGWINRSLFSQDISYYLFFSTNRHSTFVFVLFVAVIPALFEELAYRGYLLPTLLKAIDRQQAIFVTSFLFAIIHLSFLSLFWLIPFALLLGYVSVKENTMWYGVAIHFAFNLTACMFELFL